MSTPQPDRNLETLQEIRAEVMVLYAGRASEYRLAGEREHAVSTGASSDIRQATELLQRLAVFSHGNGLLDYSGFGTAGQRKVMAQCETLSKELWDETVSFLREHWEKVTAIAERLLQKDTLEEAEIRAIIENAAQPELADGED